MNKGKTPSSVAAQDYDDIQAAVMETERGRWFLNEYAQRNRVADTAMLLEAIKKLEGMVAEKENAPSSAPDVDKMRFDIVDMANAIAETKQQIADIKSSDGDDSRLDSATAELDAIVVAAETATSDILSAAENIQEVAWTMREDGATEEGFDRLDALATDIYMACSFQDITGQRTTKVISVLQYLENRVSAMMNIWGIQDTDLASLPKRSATMLDGDNHLLNGPALEGEGVDQDDIDLMMVDEDELFEAVAQPAHQDPIEDTPLEDITLEEVSLEETSPEDISMEDMSNNEIDDQMEQLKTTVFTQDDLGFVMPKTDMDDLSQTEKTALFT